MAAQFKADGADCFLFGGVTANGAVQLYKDVGAALPDAKLYGPDGNCESGFTNPAKKGIPKALGARFKCSVATLNLDVLPGRQGVPRRLQGQVRQRRARIRTRSTATRP